MHTLFNAVAKWIELAPWNCALLEALLNSFQYLLRFFFIWAPAKMVMLPFEQPSGFSFAFVSYNKALNIESEKELNSVKRPDTEPLSSFSQFIHSFSQWLLIVYLY